MDWEEFYQMISDETLNRVLGFIESYIDENGFAPSVRDICHELNIKSTATAYGYIKRLQDRGDLNAATNKKRAVSLNMITPQTKVPLLGKVTAGYPIFAVQNYQGYYNLPSSDFKGDDLFILEVSGNSMIEADIHDGDKIVVRKQSSADNGDIVVALVDNLESATVKRFYKKEDRIVLHPENPEFPDFEYMPDQEVQILGKVIGLLRRL